MATGNLPWQPIHHQVGCTCPNNVLVQNNTCALCTYQGIGGDLYNLLFNGHTPCQGQLIFTMLLSRRTQYPGTMCIYIMLFEFQYNYKIPYISDRRRTNPAGGGSGEWGLTFGRGRWGLKLIGALLHYSNNNILSHIWCL